MLIFPTTMTNQYIIHQECQKLDNISIVIKHHHLLLHHPAAYINPIPNEIQNPHHSQLKQLSLHEQLNEAEHEYSYQTSPILKNADN